MLSNCGAGEDSLRVPWTARKSNQSILKEINPEYSLEGLMPQYFGHMMWRSDSLEKTPMLGKIEGRRRRGWQTMRWLDGITDSMDMNLSKHQGYGKWQGSLECCSSWGRNESGKSEFQENIYFCYIDYAKTFGCVDHNKLWKILKEMGIPDHLTCLLWKLYVSQEATVRTGHGRMDWLFIGKGVHQGCTLSPSSFNFYAEHIMKNAGLEEAQAGINIARRNINNQGDGIGREEGGGFRMGSTCIPVADSFWYLAKLIQLCKV